MAGRSELGVVASPTVHVGPIESAEVLDAEVDRTDRDDKGTPLDIRVRFAERRQVDVDMQAAPHPALRERPWNGSGAALRRTGAARHPDSAITYVVTE